MRLHALIDFDPREDHSTVFIENRVVEGWNKLTKLEKDGSNL